MVETLGELGVPIYRQAFWMGKHGHSHPKRTCCWSNSVVVRALETGKLERGLHAAAPKTAVKYKSKSGKEGYKGSAALKGTENLGYSEHIALLLFCV